MKRIFLATACTLSLIYNVNAQNDCMAFFPSNEGAVLVNKSYDADNNLLSTLTYRVNETYNYGAENKDIQIGFTMTDGLNNVIDNGIIDAHCDDGTFFLRMVNRTICPEAADLLTENTELVGDFLDYPNTFSDDFAFKGNQYGMDGGEYSIRSKINKKTLATVRVYDRNYIKNEKITTPAGTFNASKVVFSFDVRKDDKTSTYNGVEWYAVGAGVVRSETYDRDNELLNYTELAALKDNK